jgi:hypothetical protein
MSAHLALGAVAALAGLAVLGRQGSAARPRRPRPGISRGMARARLLGRLPPHEDLEYMGAFGRYHRFIFWDGAAERSRVVHVGGLGDNPAHVTILWD